jgi:hypothetical protein
MSVPDWEDDWLAECIERGVDNPAPSIIGAVTFLRACRWCRHDMHGFKCQNCSCESSLTSRDDSWRPSLSWAEAAARDFADKYGVDGWIATLAQPKLPAEASATIRATKIKNLLAPKGHP